ncbi:MAG: beta-Ala-His dipeptidase, partial [Lachnospiraceae bacterium]|nr:beta-Ala-His dipeptidase [Lachnospiraceae bacterium]
RYDIGEKTGFAREHGLEYYQDQVNNVIMIKEASEGYETEPPIMIQGHMDIVAVKEDDCQIDMQKDGLRLAVEGDLIYAEGTSLGADDGVAVAYALALLDAQDLAHPRLEVVLTVDEEVGMEGALSIDLSMLKGRRLLNIDSEKQGELTVSCAGGARIMGTIENIAQPASATQEDRLFRIAIEGLAGGHSGTEIHHGRANANLLAGKLLVRLFEKIDCRLISVDGGTKDNVIPTSARVVVMASERKESELRGILSDYEKEMRQKYSATDPDLAVACTTDTAADEVMAFREAYTDRLIRFWETAIDGVQAMSSELEDLVETSLNMGVVRTEQNVFSVTYSIRSSVAKAKQQLKQDVCRRFELLGAKVAIGGDYPAWEMKKDSELTRRMSEVYERLFGKTPHVLAVHAGLECGILADKIPGLDCVSIGPDIYDVHTTRERLSISSTCSMWEYLVTVLGTRSPQI